MRNIDILLLSIDKRESNEEYRGIPLGIAFLAAQLKAHGFSYKVLDMYNFGINKKSVSVLTSTIKRYQPQVIGISTSAYYLKSLTIGIGKIRKTAKSLKKQIPIILGGYICLIKNALQVTNADVLCFGEGEEIIIELMNYFLEKENAKEISKIKGIIYKAKGGGYIKNPPRELITDLDKLPFPDFEPFDLHYYDCRNSFPVYVQRGCNNNCTFCDIAQFYGRQYIRRMSPERIIEMIQALRGEYDFKMIEFLDDNFLNSRKFITRLFQLLNQEFSNEYGPNLYINFQARADDILRFKDLLVEFKKFIFYIEIGIESFLQSQLNRWNKHIEASQNLECIKFLSEHSISYKCNCLWIDRDTTIDDLEQNLRAFLALPNIPVVVYNNELLKEFIPNFVYNVRISTIYDKTGTSTVRNIPFLYAAERFIEKTAEKADLLKQIYLEFKALLNKSNREHGVSQIANSFFPYTENLLENRLYKMIDITRQTSKLNPKLKYRAILISRKEVRNYNTQVRKFTLPFKKFLESRK